MPQRKHDDEDDDRPRRPKRRRNDEDEDEEPTAWDRYRRSPLRFALLGSLVLALAVLAYLLVQKVQREG